MKDLKFLSINIFGYFTLLLGILVSQSTFNEYLEPILIGAILVIIAIIIHLMGKETPWLYYVSTFLTYLSTGFVISAIYKYTEVQISEFDLLLSLLISFIYLSLYILINQYIRMQNRFIISLFIIFPLILLTILLLNDFTGFNSILFFAMFNSFYGIIAYRMSFSKSVNEAISVCGFGLFLLVLFIFIVVASEGEALDISGIAGGKNKKENKV